MFVTVIHRINDPDQFESSAQSATPNIPSHLKLHQYLTGADRKTATCLWEAPSVEEIKKYLEPVSGQFSRNEYVQLNTEGSFGLPAGTTTSAARN
ncbi:MAG: hypothetical protein GIX02_05490 [Candidatus Eremiobacteraeota bacterium]|nr:hypothetical protein [Candidatus Eremiobacteraeota bacterium]MBC5824279.1 hypothetical protein [Candidatus Eremiobacteraeota bacterium]